ncbi:MAG: DUF2628 domain-containing protein [Oscillospiraceae bacterium]|nr:DUF2628 domain-containing protein [Oscillospiraceae bacterium]
MDMNEIYLEKYVGKKEYRKFKDRWKFCRKTHGFGFNPFAFLFGPLYLFYKKMYREGAAFLAVMAIASAVVGTAAGIFAMGLDTDAYNGRKDTNGNKVYGTAFKEDFSYFELTPWEVAEALAEPPVSVSQREQICVYGRGSVDISQMTVFEWCMMPLFDSDFFYDIDSFPAFVFWAARIITNIFLCLLLALRFDFIYYKRITRLAAKQLAGIKESAAEGVRQSILERSRVEAPCHPLYIFMGLTVFGVLYPLPLPFLLAACAGAFGLLMFPVISAADYIFGDKRNAV